MRGIYAGLSTFFLMSTIYADVSIDPLIHKVSMQLTAEQWVTSKTALVNVNVNASVGDTSLEKMQSQILEKLGKLSNKSEWHLISYDRSQDKSGLENIKIVGQARLPETELGGLREKAKTISKPGETYTIDAIQFIPSDEEKHEANNALRQNIYEQVNNELTRLNKIYPDQKYYLHDINFNSDPSASMPMAQNTLYKMAGVNGSSSREPMSVGDKMRLNANVILSTLPDPNFVKLLLR